MRLSSTTCSALVLLSLLALSCSSPEIEERASSGASIRLSISVPGQAPQGPSARLVVPETLPVIASWKVSLTRAVGDQVISIHEAGGASIAVSDIDPGTWDILVEGFSGSSGSGTRLASGSYPGAVLGLGATVSVSVSARYVSSGTGGFSFRLTFPSEAADTVRYTFNGVVYVPDVLMAAGQSSVLLSASDITPGTYPLGVELVKNGGVVRRLAESVVIVPNVVSTRWLSSNGSLADVRALETTDFADNEAGLVSVSFTKGNLDVSFGQSTFNYKLQNLTAHSVAVTAMTSSDMQSIKLYVNGLLQGTLRSGQMSAPFEAPHGADILLTVTAADGVTAKVYSFTVERDHLVTFDHQAIESGKRKITFQSVSHGSNVQMKKPEIVKYQDGIKLKFRGWCKNKDGSGPILTHPTLETIIEPTTYYGIWSVLGGTGPAGGTVFYDKIVDNPSNPYAEGWRYMEIDKPSLSNSEYGNIYPWSFDEISCSTQQGIGYGVFNTLKAVSMETAPSCLTQVLEKVGGTNSKKDWFLPSYKELLLAYAFLEDTVPENYYWTSSEYNTASAMCVNYEGQTQHVDKQELGYMVRPCRMFANEKETASVLYSSNGATSGTAPVDRTLYASGTNVVFAGPGELIKTGFIFEGWCSRADGAGVVYPEGTVFAINDHKVLYAKWKPVFDDLSYSVLQSYQLKMTVASIVNSDVNRIPVGAVFMYLTSEGNLGKMTIVGHPEGTNNGLLISYFTFDSVGNQLVKDQVTVLGTGKLDLDTGIVSPSELAADIFLNNLSATNRVLKPVNGTRIYRCY